MAKSKSGQRGAVVAYAYSAVKHEGEVTAVSDLGVTIKTRAYGRQVSVNRFYKHENIIAHSDVGVGFVTTLERTEVASYYGTITADEDVIAVTTEAGREISFGDVKGVHIEMHLDDDEGRVSSTEAKVGQRSSNKFDTASARRAERSSGAKRPKATRTKGAKVGVKPKLRAGSRR